MVDSKLRDSSYDIAVVGCGMAGLAAGLAAAEEDVSVVLFEKSPENRRGGQTQFTESFRIPTADIDLDVEFNVEDYSSSDFYSDIMTVTNGRADPDLARTVTSKAAETFEWLTGYGIEWEYQAPHTGYTAGRVWLDGEEFVDELVGILQDNGVDIYYESQVQRLEQNEDREITGIEVYREDSVVKVDAGAVIIASGGYESSKEKRTRYYGPGYEVMKVRGSRYNTGEAIDMALDIGAKSEGEWSGAHMAIIDAGSPDVEGGITRVDGYQYGVILNHDGERFVDEGEDARAHTYAKFGRRIFEQPYYEAFIIVDSDVVDDVAHMGPTRPITADSIEALAQKADIENVERTVETIERFNESCGDGEYDPEVLDGCSTTGVEPPKSNWAHPIDSPPYTAFPVTGGITFSFGGVATTSETEVVDTRERVINGLYAAGNSTGGLFYNNYPGGTGLTNAAVFGRIAGKAASEYVSGS